MTALDPELSNAPLAMKIEFYELNLETPRELPSRVSATVSSSAASTADTIMQRHQPAGRPPRSPAFSAMDVPAPPVPPVQPIPQPPAGFLHRWKRHTTGRGWIGSASRCSTSGWTDSPSHPSSVPRRKRRRCLEWTIILVHMRYMTQLATTGPAAVGAADGSICMSSCALYSPRKTCSGFQSTPAWNFTSIMQRWQNWASFSWVVTFRISFGWTKLFPKLLKMLMEGNESSMSPGTTGRKAWCSHQKSSYSHQQESQGHF